MNNKLIIAVRYTGRKVVKARPLSGMNDFPEPCVGKSYFCCNLITSAVESYYKREGGGWCVKTMNSTYEFFQSTMEDAEKIAEKFGLVGPVQSNPPSLSFYWREKEEHLKCGTPWNEDEAN